MPALKYTQMLELIEQLANQGNLQNIFLNLGLNRWAYQNTAVDTSVETNYPEEWKDHYISNNYFEIDPVALASERQNAPYLWSLSSEVMTIENMDDFHRGTSQKSILSDIESEYSNEATDFGLSTGLLVPINDCDNEASYAFSPGDIGYMELRKWSESYFDLLSTICNVDYQINKPKHSSEISLTGKEREVLVWLAEGKSSWEIGKILNVSERTANYHIGNIKKKLQANNRSQIITSAFRLNLIK